MSNVLKLLLVLLAMLGPVGSAIALDFNAYWLYRASGGENVESRDEFQQRYSLGVGPEATYRPTHAITLSAALGYNRYDRDTGQGMTTGEEITPSARLNLTNDIFAAGLAGTASRFEGNSGEAFTSNSWDATLASRWDIPLWPQLSLNYGQRRDSEDSSDFFSDSGRDQTYRSLTVNWDLLLARLLYRFSNTVDEDLDTGSSSESDDHFVRLETDGRFFGNRLSYNLSQQYQQTDSTTAIGALDEEGFFELELDGDRRGKVDALTGPDPDEIDYEDPTQVIGIAPLPVGPQQRLHLSFSEGFGQPQQIDVLRLTFAQFGDQAASLSWALYRRDSLDGSWILVRDNIPGVFDALDEFVEVPVGLTANEILVVAENASGITLSLTSLRAFSQVTEGGGSRFQSYLTNAGLQARLTQTLSASANMTLEHQKIDGGDSTQENTRRTLSGRLRWSPKPWITPSLGYSESREERTLNPDLLNRTYSLTVATTPLPTTNVTLGITQTERFTGDQKTDETLRYSLTTAATIYPDLNASLFLTWLDGKRYPLREPDADPGIDPEVDETTTFTSRLNLNARLTRQLIADLIANYRTSERTTGDSETADATLNLQYRPSTLLLVRGFYTAYLLDSTQEDVLGGGFDLALLRTRKTRLTLTYSVVQADETSQNFGLNGSWDISQNLSLQTQGNYIMSEADFYSIQASLNLRL